MIGTARQIVEQLKQNKILNGDDMTIYYADMWEGDDIATALTEFDVLGYDTVQEWQDGDTYRDVTWPQFVRRVFDKISKDYDANFGVNWDTITFAAGDVIAEIEKEWKENATDN